MNQQEEESIKIKAYRVFESSKNRPKKQTEIIEWERERMDFVENYVRNALIEKKKEIS
ncbi:MAG: hypothetical protein PHZ25_01585 [Candidatus Pacebacteria bacterium]|nr:hypothetical protein [Candidatus Paceibacterota bacterium]